MMDLDFALAVPFVCFAVVVLIVGYAWLLEYGAGVLAWAREQLARDRDPDRELLALMDTATPLWLELEELAPWPHEASTRTAGACKAPAVEGPDREEGSWVSEG
jgi:hypothetical protein